MRPEIRPGMRKSVIGYTHTHTHIYIYIYISCWQEKEIRTDEHGQSESILLAILPIERFDTRLAVQIWWARTHKGLSCGRSDISDK